MPEKRALIFGGTGQIGSYLNEFLTEKAYNVISLGSADLSFSYNSAYVLGAEFRRILSQVHPDEVYNFVGRMHAEESWKNPLDYIQVNGIAVQILLEAVLDTCPEAKFFNAGSADMFDKAMIMQYEDTEKKPNSPHGLSKLLAFELVRMYREKGLFASTGIFFNAESPRRAKTFFAQKVISEVVRLKRELEQGSFKPLQLGRLNACRDWGWAPEFAEVAWRILQADPPMDFIIGTGEYHTCKEFVEEALKAAGVPDVDKKFDDYVLYEKEAEYRRGDTMWAQPVRAAMLLNWKPQYKMKDVIRRLVEAEVKCGESIAVGQS